MKFQCHRPSFFPSVTFSHSLGAHSSDRPIHSVCLPHSRGKQVINPVPVLFIDPDTDRLALNGKPNIIDGSKQTRLLQDPVDCKTVSPA